jgi:hypothetical protein
VRSSRAELRYLQVMRRLVLIAVLVLGLAACGSSSQAAKPVRVQFGTAGGSIRPQTFALTVNGDLASEVQKALAPGGLPDRSCPGTMPDAAAEFIRVGGHTVTVRGSCEPHFTRLWNKLHALRGG